MAYVLLFLFDALLTILSNNDIEQHEHAQTALAPLDISENSLGSFNSTRRHFSKDDTINLVDWLARNNPNNESRKGNNLWKQLMNDKVLTTIQTVLISSLIECAVA